MDGFFLCVGDQVRAQVDDDNDNEYQHHNYNDNNIIIINNINNNNNDDDLMIWVHVSVLPTKRGWVKRDSWYRK